MATSSEHHKKRIESYKTSWAPLCQSAEGKALWEAVAWQAFQGVGSAWNMAFHRLGCRLSLD